MVECWINMNVIHWVYLNSCTIEFLSKNLKENDCFKFHTTNFTHVWFSNVIDKITLVETLFVLPLSLNIYIYVLYIGIYYVNATDTNVQGFCADDKLEIYRS